MNLPRCHARAAVSLSLYLSAVSAFLPLCLSVSLILWISVCQGWYNDTVNVFVKRVYEMAAAMP